MGDVTGLAGVLIWTDAARHPAMATFYRDVLGLPVRTQREGFISFAWPGGLDVRLTIGVHAEVAGPAKDPLRIMLNLGVDDIVGAYERLTRDGVSFTRPPEQEKWGGWIATFADPDGNVVQLLQPPAPRPD
jgi:predicted enzyme related to lactoylglutathione lyase